MGLFLICKILGSFSAKAVRLCLLPQSRVILFNIAIEYSLTGEKYWADWRVERRTEVRERMLTAIWVLMFVTNGRMELVWTVRIPYPYTKILQGNSQTTEENDEQILFNQQVRTGKVLVSL